VTSSDKIYLEKIAVNEKEEIKTENFREKKLAN
jgi:hypothetical protein